MPSTYSLDLRTRVLNDCLAGLTCTNVARKYSVSRIWVHNLKKQYQETGSIEPKKYKRGRKRKLEPYEQEVRQLLADHPDITLVQLCEKLSPLVSVCPAALWNFLQHMKITWKKNALCRRTTSTRRYRKAGPMETTARVLRHRKTRFER